MKKYMMFCMVKKRGGKVESFYGGIREVRSLVEEIIEDVLEVKSIEVCKDKEGMFEGFKFLESCLSK